MTIDTEQYYETLTNVCNERWKSLASSVYKEIPDFIARMFGEFLNNPLCLAITSVLLTVAGFVVMKRIIFSFNRGASP